MRGAGSKAGPGGGSSSVKCVQFADDPQLLLNVDDKAPTGQLQDDDSDHEDEVDVSIPEEQHSLERRHRHDGETRLVARLSSELAEVKRALAATRQQLTLQETRTKQVLSAWMLRVDEGKRRVEATTSQHDLQLRDLMGTLLYLEGTLRREQGALQQRFVHQQCLIARLQETGAAHERRLEERRRAIDMLTRENRELRARLRHQESSRGATTLGWWPPVSTPPGEGPPTPEYHPAGGEQDQCHQRDRHLFDWFHHLPTYHSSPEHAGGTRGRPRAPIRDKRKESGGSSCGGGGSTVEERTRKVEQLRQKYRHSKQRLLSAKLDHLIRSPVAAECAPECAPESAEATSGAMGDTDRPDTPLEHYDLDLDEKFLSLSKRSDTRNSAVTKGRDTPESISTGSDTLEAISKGIQTLDPNSKRHSIADCIIKRQDTRGSISKGSEISDCLSNGRRNGEPIKLWLPDPCSKGHDTLERPQRHAGRSDDASYIVCGDRLFATEPPAQSPSTPLTPPAPSSTAAAPGKHGDSFSSQDSGCYGSSSASSPLVEPGTGESSWDGVDRGNVSVRRPWRPSQHLCEVAPHAKVASAVAGPKGVSTGERLRADLPAATATDDCELSTIVHLLEQSAVPQRAHSALGVITLLSDRESTC